jgi:hypothetical protein
MRAERMHEQLQVDPAVPLGLWLPERRAWVDEGGRELAIPTDGSRGVTYLGDNLAVMVHDRDLLDQPRLFEAVERLSNRLL